jgi:superfamily II DNA or RNA helicase
MPWTAVRSTGWPRLLAEHLVPVPEPLALALAPGPPAGPAAVAACAARALLDLPATTPQAPPWLAPHQAPALARLRGLLDCHGGAVLADAVGLGKSYIALALAIELGGPATLIVPAVLVPQWSRLLEEKGADAQVVTHERLSRSIRAPLLVRPGLSPGVRRAKGLIIVDEAHRFRNPETLRYRALAELCVGARVLLVTATPVHNRIADLFHLLRLFLRDDALTALGVGSLARAARGEIEEAALTSVAARLVVARSRQRVGPQVKFPTRAGAIVLRAGPASPPTIDALVDAIVKLDLGGRAGALLRLTLLRRLASSMAAFRSTLARYRAFAGLATQAAADGRHLAASDFQRLFPRGDGYDLQLTLLPLLLDEVDLAPSTSHSDNLHHLDNLEHLAWSANDPKVDALERLLAQDRSKTIVFTAARESARYLLRRLGRGHRVAAVTGVAGWFGHVRTSPQEVLATFAPLAQGAPAPAAALATDVLIATDLASEGLNLQDACRVIHYDLPWSPAQLAQRVGRIDRLGSPHEHVATVAFLPPPALAQAIGIEGRLARKLAEQQRSGAAQRETAAGPAGGPGPFDWCDRLQRLARAGAEIATGWACVTGDRATVLVVRIGAHAEAIVVREGVARAAPELATGLLERAAGSPAAAPDRARLDAALTVAAPLLRSRLAALQAARWRAADRDRLARRLIPWVLTASRSAAHAGDATSLTRLDALVSRLTLGMTAGEELGLRELVERRATLAVHDLLVWHERLPPVSAPAAGPSIDLVAAVVFSP